GLLGGEVLVEHRLRAAGRAGDLGGAGPVVAVPGKDGARRRKDRLVPLVAGQSLSWCHGHATEISEHSLTMQCVTVMERLTGGGCALRVGRYRRPEWTRRVSSPMTT